MIIIVEAVYENGVLKPSQPLSLNEHERVTVTITPSSHADAAPRFADLLGFVSDLPDAPADLSDRHDHYLYGTPKP